MLNPQFSPTLFAVRKAFWDLAAWIHHHLPRFPRFLIHRVVAKFVDLIIILFLSAVLIYPLGPLLGFLYSLLADGTGVPEFRGQSFGKKLFKLQVLDLKTGVPADWRLSIYRNAPIGVATFFALVPVWGWIILLLIGIPLMLMELGLLARQNHSRRLGDLMAGTEVVELQ